ncbi:hypothetical protein HDU88_002771 [Geranomyces variabilis]|nr:hypothetical protein HDU88_002771 [Geranomyces variabilis]
MRTSQVYKKEMTKLPAFLADSHKRYKADTGNVLRWLYIHAQQLGHAVPVPVMVAPISASAACVKGRSRQSDKAYKRQVQMSRYKFTLQQVKDMAMCVVRGKTAVPERVFALARRAIRVRKSCAEWFATLRNNCSEKQEADSGHWHFIQVLEEVVAMLTPLKRTDEPAAVPAASPEPASDTGGDEMGLENRYALLDVDELEEDDESSGLPEADSKETVYEIQPEKEGEKDEGVIFTLYCLFQDLHNIREFLHETWKAFRVGQLDLITASVTTNTAVDLVRNIQDDLTSIHPQIADYDTAAKLLFVYAAHWRGQALEHVDNENMADVADFLMMHTQSTLLSLSKVISPQHFPWYNGQFGWYDPKAAREKFDLDQHIAEDRLILMEAMPDLVMMARFERDTPLKDELTKEFGIFAATKRIPVALVFASQIYVDIHNILRERAAVGLTVLRLCGARITESLKQRAKENPTVPIENWPAQNERSVELFQQFIDTWITGDRLHAVRKHLAGNLGVGRKLQPYSLMRRHPWLCGLMQFKMQLIAQELGMVLAGAWGSITYTAQLYEACRYSATLEGLVWEDMELVMEANGKEKLFKGRVPTTPVESMKSFCLMVGTSPQEFAGTDRVARNREKRGRLLGSISGPTGLQESSPVSIMFRERFCRGQENVFTVESVDRLLHESSKSKLPPKLRRSWARTHQLTPLQLLYTLRAGLLAERKTLRFDYIRMHTRCLSLLRDLYKQLDPTFRRCIGDDYFENEVHLAWLPGWVFLLMTESAGTSRRLKMGEIYDRLGIMAMCGEVVMRWIKREGDVECKALRRFA